MAHRSGKIALSAVLAALALTACGGGDDAAEPVRQAQGITRHWMEVARANADAHAPLTIAAIEDYWITTDELNHAIQARTDCLAEHGFEAVRRSDGGWDLVGGPAPGPIDIEAFDLADSECSASTGYSNISWWYQELRENPEGLGMDTAMVRCFDERQVPGFQGMTKAQMSSILFVEDFYPCSVPADPDFLACYVDPFGTNPLPDEERLATLLLVQEATGC